MTTKQILAEINEKLGEILKAVQPLPAGIVHTPFGDYDPNAPRPVPQPEPPVVEPLPPISQVYVKDKNKLYYDNIYAANGWKTPELYVEAIKRNWDLWKMDSPNPLPEPAAFVADYPQYFAK